MTLIRSRKARLLEKAGLRYFGAWLPEDEAAEFEAKAVAAQKLVASILLIVDK